MAHPVLIKIAVTALSDKRIQKVILSIVCFILGIVIIISSVFSSILSGLFGLLFGSDVKSSWNALLGSLEDVFSGIESNISIDIKGEVYTFMPDFSVNLSKATIAANFGDSILLTYDTNELNLAAEKLGDIAYEVRNSNNIPAIYAADENFMNNTGDFDSFSEQVKTDLHNRVKSFLPGYDYRISEYTDDNDRPVTKQTLTVNDGDYTRIVEYVNIGGGIIYVPHFMSLFQTRQLIAAFGDTEQFSGYDNADNLEEDLETAFSALPDNESEISSNYSENFMGSDENDIASLNFLERNALAVILEDTLTSGEMNAWTEYDEGEDYKKLTVYLESPGETDWYAIFGLDESHESSVKEFEQIIKQKLDEAEISEAERYLSLDSMVQANLFQYFEGLFNLPVESEDLKLGTNGILSAYGDIGPIHMISGTLYRNYEQGLTLRLESSNVPVMVELLPIGDCIENIMIYDVFDANDDVFLLDRMSYTYNYCSVKLAYEINLERFEKIYGFPFPTAMDRDGTVYETYTNYLIFIVEYSCLDRLNKISKFNIGQSLYDVFKKDEPVVIGYAHNGLPSVERGDTSNANRIKYHKLTANDPIPHVCVKTSLKFGYLPYREYFDSDYYANYSNPNNGMPGADLELNPILWFKSFRTDLSDTVLKGLVAIEIK